MGNRTRRSAGRGGEGDAPRGQASQSRPAGGAGRRGQEPRRSGRQAGRPSARRGSSARGPRIGWGRRIGLLGGLLLAGAGIVFAGQALQGGTGAPPGSATPDGQGAGHTSSPRASPTLVAGLPPAPVLDAPPGATAARMITISGRLEDALPAGRGPYRLRIYVNDQPRREVRIGRQEMEFSVGNVPLVRGPNSIRAAVAGDFGETLHSAAVVVERDDEPPAITLEEPGDGAVVYQATATLRGTTEPGAIVSVSNPAGGSGGSTLADDAGAFTLPVSLALGLNRLVLSSGDAVGNTVRLELAVERRESSAGAAIELSRDTFDIDRLPATISITVYLSGVDGQPLDGVEVTFSLSAPGQMTTTYSTLASAGVARWPVVLLPREGAIAGRGLVTVMAALDAGQELRNSASFTFR